MTRWLPVAALVAAQIAYPLLGGTARAGLVIATVVAGCGYSLGHALLTRGPRVAAALALVAVAGFALEAVGVATGVPFGRYGYSGALGPTLAGVPVVVGLAWAWMAWPAWLAAGRLGLAGAARVGVAAVALATWDLFLDPQMVSQGYWHWAAGPAGLPGVASVPWTNYLGWLLVSLVLITGLRLAGGPAAGAAVTTLDTPMLVLYLWTYFASVLAHAVFLGLPASACWGALGMGLVALPLTVHMVRSPPDLVQP